METSLTEALKGWREPTTRGVSLYFNPKDHSTDNMLLFSATYLMLLSKVPDAERDWFTLLVRSCESAPGCYNRYPGDTTDLNAQDDMTGVAAVAWKLKLPFAREIYMHGVQTDFDWNNVKPDEWTWNAWFTRIVGFVPFLRVAAGLKIGYWSQLEIAVSFLASCFTKAGNTNGKCLLYIRSVVLYGQGYTIVDTAIDIWRLVMMYQYPAGVKDMYKIYFPAFHPFIKFSPSKF